MKAEQARKKTVEALDQLAAALDAGQSDGLTRYLATMAKFHRYSFGNILLIASQKPDATHVAGHRAWMDLDRHVKKGERGIAIIAPLVFRKAVADVVSSDEDGETTLRFRAVHVFDISQTEGEPLPEFAAVSGNPEGFFDGLKRLVSSHGIDFGYSATLGSAEGASFGGRILLREGLSPAHGFSVLTHELAHELMHKKEERRTLSKTVRETEAEAVAFVVSHAIGLETNSAGVDYIHLYQGTTDTLSASLDRIQRTATLIIQGITEKPVAE